MTEKTKLTMSMPQTDADYWRNICNKEVERKREWKAIAVRQAGDVDALKGEVNSLTVQLNAARAERKRQKNDKVRFATLLVLEKRSGKENVKLAELLRSHLDDSADDMESDNEWEQDARQITWNEVDNKASRRIHCEPESTERAVMDQAMADAEGIDE